MSRWGGFRRGRRVYKSKWSQIKAANTDRPEPVVDTPQEFAYTEAQGIWNLRSTLQFPKSNEYVPPPLPIWVDQTLASTVTADDPYSDAVSAQNATSYTVSAGSLPTGISINTSTGAVTGTPTTAGSYDFTIEASGAEGSISKAFNITVEAATVPAGQQAFVTVGTSSFVVPSGVTSISAVAVGGGGASGASRTISNQGGSGGGGGGLAYGTISVTPGETLTITVGEGGTGTSGNGNDGGDSILSRGSTALLRGNGGGGGVANQTDPGGSGGTSGGQDRDGGGSGGQGGSASNNSAGGAGGGAGGYSGNGGRGSTGNGNANGTAGSGGAAGGGGSNSGGAAGGGGVGLLGEGASGGKPASGAAGQGGSGGQDGFTDPDGRGGTYGGGGGAEEDDTPRNGADGGQGAVRIIWGEGRSYPSTNTADV